jgi:hypothetical protein
LRLIDVGAEAAAVGDEWVNQTLTTVNDSVGEPSTPSLPSSDEAGTAGKGGKPRARKPRKKKRSPENE